MSESVTPTEAEQDAPCGAVGPLVIGRCGRDVGHVGAHRSTGETFAASWTIADAPRDEWKP